MFRVIATFDHAGQKVSTGHQVFSNLVSACEALADELLTGITIGLLLVRGVLEEEREGRPFASHVFFQRSQPRSGLAPSRKAGTHSE